MAKVYRTVNCFFLRFKFLRVPRLYIQIHEKALKRTNVLVDANLVPLLPVGLDRDDLALPERGARVVCGYTLRVILKGACSRFLDRLADRVTHALAGQARKNV